MDTMSPEAKRRALGLLRIEIENLRKRGFGGSLCMGIGAGPSFDCCENCPLVDLAPSEHRNAESPCRHIPLNQQGESIETILRKGDQTYLEAQLITWMEQTALCLQKELWP